MNVVTDGCDLGMLHRSGVGMEWGGYMDDRLENRWKNGRQHDEKGSKRETI